MKGFPRLSEYKILLYRIGLVYLFYMFARILFYVYNQKLIKIDSVTDFIKLCYHGLAFDTTSILYANALFIILSVLPLVITTKKGFQKFLFYLYFITNLLLYVTNFIDFIYYRYTFNRSTRASLDTLESEQNKSALFYNFLINYWHVFLLFFVTVFVWIYLYKRVKIKHQEVKPTIVYFSASILSLLDVYFFWNHHECLQHTRLQ